MKLLVAQAYHLRFDPKLWAEMKPYPPLGSLIAAAVCRAEGCEVAFHDSMLADDVREFAARVTGEQPDVVLLYEDNFNYLTKMCLLNMREAARHMLKAANQAGATGIVCGSDATDHPDIYFAMGAGFVLLGEGEATLQELLQCLANHTDPALIAGLAVNPDTTPGKPVGDTSAGAVTSAAALNRAAALNKITSDAAEHNADHQPVRRKVINRLDDLPLPAWDLVDLDRYERIWQDRHGYCSINLATTRGCPYHCNWCAKPIWGQRYNARSPDHVAAELELLHTQTTLDHVWFADDIFGLKPGWTARFAAALTERGLRIRYKCLSRADLLLRPGEIEGLRASGCETVWIGAESGSQQILDAMEKGTTIEQISQATQRLRAAGIRVGYFIQLGYPGEGWPEIRATLRFILTNLPDEMGISVSYPLPGTGFHDQVAAQLTGKQNWVDSSDLAMMYAGRFPTVFYRRLYAYVHQRLALAKLLGRHEARTLRNVVRTAVYACLSGLNGILLLGLQYAGRDTGIRIAPTLDRLGSGTPTPQPGD